MTDRQNADLAATLQEKARELFRLAKLAIAAGFDSTDCDLFLEGLANDIAALKREQAWAAKNAPTGEQWACRELIDAGAISPADND